MSYAARASRFLADRRDPEAAGALDRERSEKSEERSVAPPATDDGWANEMRSASAAALHLPPTGCLGPRVCSRIGVCDRHAAGRPCEVAS